MKRIIVPIFALLMLLGQSLVAQTTYKTLQFDGVDDYLNAGNDASLHPTSFSYAGWVKGSVLDSDTVMRQAASAGSQDSVLMAGWSALNAAYNKKAVFGLYSGTTWTGQLAIGTTDLDDNQWHFLVGTYDDVSKLTKVYVDGVEEASVTIAAPARNAGANLFVGRYPLAAADIFEGSMCSAKMFNTALTAAQVTELYNSGTPKVHGAYSATIKDNCVLAIEGAEDLPTSTYEESLNAISDMALHVRGGNFVDLSSASATVTNSDALVLADDINKKDVFETNHDTLNRYYSSNAKPATTGYEIYGVFKADSYTGGGVYSRVMGTYRGTGALASDEILMSELLGNMVFFAGTTSTTLTSPATGKYFSIGMRQDGSNNVNVFLDHNTASFTGGYTVGSSEDLGVGQDANGGTSNQGLDGKNALVLLFNKVLTTTERNTVNRYINAYSFPLRDLSDTFNTITENGSPTLSGAALAFEDPATSAPANPSENNSYTGTNAGYNNTGEFNTFLGNNTGFNNTTGTGNIFLGNSAGYNETGSNKLYISNSDSSTPLIYGEFDNQLLQINGELRVAGQILATKVHVQLQTSWPDYVFNKDYKLPTIEELAAHIEKHKHLPGIPPAAELEKNGVSLTDVMSKQMEKIEELTLYVIQLKKANEKLKKEKDMSIQQILERLNALEKVQ